jgi:hypothetical protein
MVRYSFLVGLFHPLLHAGLSRRLRSLAVMARHGVSFPSRDRQGAVILNTSRNFRNPVLRRSRLFSRAPYILPPHSGQNFTGAGASNPHFPHFGFAAAGVPHSGQNLAFPTSAPQLPQHRPAALV